MAYYPSKVITTGPTERQVEKVVWGEIRAAHQRAAQLNPGLPIGGYLLPNSPELRSYNSDPAPGDTDPWDPHHYIMGFVGKSADAYQGFHEENVLIIVTEAQGIDPDAQVAIDSLMTASNAKLILIGNPTCEPDHEFFKSHTTKRHIYSCVNLDSRESSHCEPSWIQEIKDVHGDDSPYFQMRVEGKFLENMADTLIPLSQIMAAQERFETTPRGEPKTAGLDVARQGSDFTVCYIGHGDRFERAFHRQGQDLMATVGDVRTHRKKAGVEAKNVRLDDTGVGGGVTDRLVELDEEPTPINFGADSTDEEKYKGCRSEMAWELRERFRTGRIAIDPKDKLLERDLLVLKWKPTSSEQIHLEPKPLAKKRLKGHSPDFADALMMAAIPIHVAEGIEAGKVIAKGFLDFARQRTKQLKEGGESKKLSTAVRKIPAVEIHPEAARIIGRTDGTEEDRGRWTSTLP